MRQRCDGAPAEERGLIRTPGYALAPVFCVRAAGVPFAHLEALATPEVAAAARALLAAEEAVDRAGADAIANAIANAIAANGEDDRGARRALKRQIRNRRPISDEQRAAQPWLEAYGRAAVEHARARASLEQAIEREALRVHGELRRHALEVLPDFAALESEAMLGELAEIAAAPPRTTLRTSDRKTDRSLAMYLQRVCAKNDTISRFGPSGWGRVVDGAGLRIRPAPGIAARSVEVERWVVIGLIEAMNADPGVRAEVCPRLHPDVELTGEAAARVDREQEIPLTAEDRALLARCDGTTPAHRAGDPAALARLTDAGVLVWELERFGVDGSPLASLIADVEAWREGEVRARWLPRLERLRGLAAAFGAAEGAARRREVIAGLCAEVAALGVAARDRGRTLYAAGNPVSENCYREYGIELGARDAERLVTEAAPWLDLFHDAYALGVARAFERYRELAIAAPRRAGRLSYAALIAFARTRDLDVDTDAALVRIGSEAFDEIRRALGDALAGRADAPEWELTAEDCHVLRRRHDLPEVAELAWPQADLQLAAPSLEDVAAGRYTWIVAELHHALTPLQHAGYWSCPDKPALHAAMAAAMAHRPFAARGALAGQPVHIAAEALFAALPRPSFVGRGRPKPGWRAVRPADAEVIIDEAARDVRLRAPGGEDLGSLVRSFRLLMGMHPFFPFERVPHAPRLRLGGTVVQRRTWRVASAELGEPRPIGLSPAFLAGVERLRRDRGVPRWVFARPAAGSHRTFDVLARDKDLKPIYLDLESTLFLEILERRLRSYGELVLSEMLPAPDQLVWSEPASRVVFELRTSVVPR